MLAAARSLRTEVFRAAPSADSPATHDLQESQKSLGSRRPVERAVLCGDLWTAIAADHLYGASLVLRDGTTGFGLFPLLRSVVEHCTLAVWVLDERVTAPIRGARAAVCEVRSAEGETASTSHMYGRDSDYFRDARRRLTQIQEEIKSEEAGFAALGLTVEYGKPPKPTDIVMDYGARLGNPVVWQGVYDFMCSMATHPNLDAVGLASVTPEGVSTGFTLPSRFIKSLLPYAIRPYLAAISRLGAYMGWEWREQVDAYSGRVDSVLSAMNKEETG